MPEFYGVNLMWQMVFQSVATVSMIKSQIFAGHIKLQKGNSESEKIGNKVALKFFKLKKTNMPLFE